MSKPHGAVAIGILSPQKEVLLVREGAHPLGSKWKFPVETVREDENLKDTALRGASKEVGIDLSGIDFTYLRKGGVDRRKFRPHFYALTVPQEAFDAIPGTGIEGDTILGVYSFSLSALKKLPLVEEHRTLVEELIHHLS